MKLNTKIVAGLLATSAVAFGVVANAEPAGKGCDGMGPMGGGMQGRGMMRDGPGMMGDPAARAEQRIAQFKSELKITPQQEPLWTAFTEKMKTEAGQGMKAMRDKAQQPMTAPERLAQTMAVMKERMAAMESVGDSFKRLYEALTPEQKAIADKQPGIFGGHMPQRQGRPAVPPGKGAASEHNHG